MGFQPSYQTEAHIYAQYLLETHPTGGKIAILYQDDEFGKDYVKGLKDGLGGKIPIVAEAAYKITDANINQQVAKLKAVGCGYLLRCHDAEIRRRWRSGAPPNSDGGRSTSSPRFPIRSPPSCSRRDWKIRKALLSAGYTWEGDDPAAASDPAYREWAAFMDRYVPDVSRPTA